MLPWRKNAIVDVRLEPTKATQAVTVISRRTCALAALAELKQRGESAGQGCTTNPTRPISFSRSVTPRPHPFSMPLRTASLSIIVVRFRLFSAD
jgi:hypothetical protein